MIKGKGMLGCWDAGRKKIESSRPWIPIWAWFSEQLSCTRVMAFSPTSYFYVSPTNQSGKTGNKNTSRNLFARLLQNELNCVLPLTKNPTCLATNQVVAGCENLLHKVETGSK